MFFYKLLFNQNEHYFDPQEEGKIICKKIERQSPVYEVNYETFEGTNGSREVNASFRPFNLTLTFDIFYKDEYDKILILTDLYNYIFPGYQYYITHSLEPGKRYRVNPTDFKASDEANGYTQVEISLTVPSGCSESLSSTLSDFSLDEEWQFSQGLASEDYSYTSNFHNFVIYNGGDFLVDPRDQYLKITIEASSDSNLTIFNKTTGDRFIYYPGVDIQFGQTLTLDGVYPKLNGINCGIDTNHGLITLAPGENQIEISNANLVKTKWDFKFLYK